MFDDALDGISSYMDLRKGEHQAHLHRRSSFFFFISYIYILDYWFVLPRIYGIWYLQLQFTKETNSLRSVDAHFTGLLVPKGHNAVRRAKKPVI